MGQFGQKMGEKQRRAVSYQFTRRLVRRNEVKADEGGRSAFSSSCSCILSVQRRRTKPSLFQLRLSTVSISRYSCLTNSRISCVDRSSNPLPPCILIHRIERRLEIAGPHTEIQPHAARLSLRLPFRRLRIALFQSRETENKEDGAQTDVEYRPLGDRSHDQEQERRGKEEIARSKVLLHRILLLSVSSCFPKSCASVE